MMRSARLISSPNPSKRPPWWTRSAITLASAVWYAKATPNHPPNSCRRDPDSDDLADLAVAEKPER